MILNAYKENWETIVTELGKLRDEMAEGRKQETEGISTVEAPFFDLLKVNLINAGESEIQKTKELTHVLMNLLMETAAIKNFWTDKAAERKKIEGFLEDEIYYAKIPGLSEKAAELRTELMKLAKNREADLR
jgi:hypothetical protein